MALLLAGVVAVPLPYRVTVPAMVDVQDAHRVYVSAAGTLLESLPVGSEVKAGDTIARLENLDLRLDVERLQSGCNQQRLRVQNLERRQVSDAQAAAQLPAAQEGLSNIKRLLERRLTEQQRLTLTAPVAGKVIPPHTEPPHRLPDALGKWSGTPLDLENRQAYLETGTLFCRIGDPHRLEAILAVDQSELDLIEPGQQVRVQLDQLPGICLQGTIREVSKMDLRVVPRALMAAGDLPSQLDSQGIARPRGTVYRARRTRALHGQRSARCHGLGQNYRRPRSLGSRLTQFLRQTFQLEL